jgi:Cd2+/Zn2+-exporting ATPase
MKTTRHQWALEGLHCAGCAKKIENAVQRMEGVAQASLDFANANLLVELHEHQDPMQIVTQIEEIMARIEPGSSLKKDTKEDEGEEEGNGKKIILYALGAVLFVLAIIIPSGSPFETGLFVLSYVIFGWEVLLKSVKNILKGQVFDENFLMGIASIGAFFLGEYPEAAAVMMFYQIGELFQDYAVDKSRKSIKSLVNIRPDFANLKTDKGFERISPANVRIGDTIIVRPGERVPLDGIVIEGHSALDTSALTGESLPRDVAKGDEILSGSINQSGVLEIQVAKDFNNSTVSRILALVEEAAHKKAVTERFITRFAAWYTPIVVGLAFALAVLPPLLTGSDAKEWIYRALTFLVVSCPCALVISIPLGFFGGIGAASRRGILVKGGNYLEALAKLNTVVFDKTGTLTKGSFQVKEIMAVNGLSEKELLEYTALSESYSTHPIARSIVKAYGTEPDQSRVSEYKEISGEGVLAHIDGKQVLCGNRRLLEKNGVALPELEALNGLQVLVAIDGVFAGRLALNDVIKPDAAETIRGLKQLGIRNTVILTGDQKYPSELVAHELGIDKVYAQLLPQDKVSVLEALMAENKGNGKLAFVGDGINDAAVITRADVGIAMGGMGADAAIEAADIVIMNDEPGKLCEAIHIARKTRSVVIQNILLAGIVKLLVLALSAGGLSTMWEAVFADVGVALLAILNAMRLINGRSAGSPVQITKRAEI